MSEWISVKDRLPEIYVDVNTCDSKNNVSTGCLSPRTTRKRKLIWSTRHRGSKTDVMYWMPLPEPPKEQDHSPENCRYYTTKCFSREGCMATREIDPCKGDNCERWEPKEEE